MPQGQELAAISRRLGILASERLGRHFTVRLGHPNRGFLILVDWEARLAHWYSWEADEPADSARNAEHFAGAVACLRDHP